MARLKEDVGSAMSREVVVLVVVVVVDDFSTGKNRDLRFGVHGEGISEGVGSGHLVEAVRGGDRTSCKENVARELG